ncbi:MAG: TonB-dependent receptor [Rikenellaceae bacterium]
MIAFTVTMIETNPKNKKSAFTLFKKLFMTKLTFKTRTLLTVSMFVAFSLTTIQQLYAEEVKSELTQQKTAVKGKVLDPDGQPLIGATVVVKGTSSGAVTNANGEFEFQAPQNSTLEVNFIGYKVQQVALGTRTSVIITMETDALMTDEVVVVGFGTQKKVNLTGAVSTVTADAFKSRPVQNAVQALQGMVPGLNITPSNGGVEAKQNINVRGTTTIDAGSKGDPLVLIDGMEGDITTINPQDIESVSVLKDAAASSIYGSRAPFGVILVTTKSGTKGKITVNYNNSFRFAKPTYVPDVVDSYRFAKVVNEAAVNDNRSTDSYFKQGVIDNIVKYRAGEITTGLPTNSSNYSGMMYTANGDTNWWNEYVNKSTFSHEHTLSINGGGEKLQVYASMNYLDQNGLMKVGKEDYKRYATNLRVTGDIFSFLKFSYNVKFNREDYERPFEQAGNIFELINLARPNYPATDNNGHFYELEYRNPALNALDNGGRYRNRVDNMYQQFRVTATPIKNWNINAEINYRLSSTNTHQDSQIYYNYDLNELPVKPQYAKSASAVTEYNKTSNYMNPNIYSDYSISINDAHNFKIMVGFQSEQLWYSQISASRNGIIIPGMDQIDVTNGMSSTGQAIPPSVKGNYNGWATAGVFGRFNYDYKGRYLAEVNLRYDGTSRFRSDRRWDLFPSFSAGWNIAKEKFWENLIGTCSVLKIRGSYGELGNQNTTSLYPTYQSLPVGSANGGWLIGNVKPNTAAASGLINSEMTWETVKSTNIGLDVAFLRNRLTGSFEWFRRRTSNMVGPAPELPGILGTSVPKENNTELQSQGWELAIKWQDRLKNGFGYSASFILSDAKGKIISYPNKGLVLDIPVDGTYGARGGEAKRYWDGQKLGDIWGYETIGIAQSQAEMDAHLASLPKGGQSALGKSFGAGDIMYKDLDGDGKISSASGTLDAPGDLKIIGNSTPRYNFGLDLAADWKGFDLRVFFQGTMKRDFATWGNHFMGMSAGVQGMFLEEHMDYFRLDPNHEFGQNLDAYLPRPIMGTSNPKNNRIQTRYVQNAAYIRLKNLQIGYTIPQKISSKFGVSNLRVFLSGENLWTGTKLMKAFDPETLNLGGSRPGVAYPLQKIYSFGVSINF